MQNDEQEIRDLVSTWMAATKAGDVDTVLSLMTDDVVFLVPGQPVMRKADFAAPPCPVARNAERGCAGGQGAHTVGNQLDVPVSSTFAPPVQHHAAL